MKATVYYASADAHEKKENNLLNKVGRLYERLGVGASLRPMDLVAVKTHFGEGGCTRYLRPIYVQRIVECLQGDGLRPFLTDSNTYYVDRRHNAYEHLMTAQRHGFYPPQIGAPIVIADGLVGQDHVEVEVQGDHFNRVRIASAIHSAGAVVSVAHFKGHVVTGFGGALKNMGVGCASRDAKLTIHGARALISGRCTGCRDCVAACPIGAIAIPEAGGNPVVNPDTCDSCGVCSLSCTADAVDPDWGRGSLYTKEGVQERMVEYAAGALKEKQGKAFYFNFLLDVTPECDCEPWSDIPIVKDLGVLASTDIVAVDQASVDLVNQQEGVRGSLLKKGLGAGEDKFRALNGVDWSSQLAHAEKMGLGTRKYSLIEA
ncbi:MAG: DUF362 domain-containing protein [Candidatus Bathyarchaeota archaeon]